MERYLVFKVECRQHCCKTADFRVIAHAEKQDGIVGVYICPNGFVSRVVYFSLEPNLNWFYAFLSGQLGKKMVQKRDLRIATRYGWELDEDATRELAYLTSKLQTQAIGEVYRLHRPETEVEKSRGVLLCSDPEQGRGCRRLFVQEVTSRNRLCSKCV